MNLNYTLSFLIAGGILLLAFIMIINPLNTNKKGNFHFGLFLLIYSTFWLDEAFIYQQFSNDILLIVTKNFIQFLVPILFYISIKSYTNPSYQFEKRDLGSLLLPALYLLSLFYRTSFDNSISKAINLTLIIGNALYHTALSYMTIINHQRNIELFISNKESIDLNWIKNIIYIIIGATILYALYGTFIDSDSLNIYANICFLAIVYMIAYYSIKQQEIYPKKLDITEIVENDVESENQKSKDLISTTDLELLKQKLLHMMDVEKPYLDSELNLVKLADKLSLSTHQLSYIINNGFNENFFQFINKYKVEKAQDLLTSPEYSHYTIIAIGYEAGFNSKTSFNTTFKKLTNYTPSEYRKIGSKL